VRISRPNSMISDCCENINNIIGNKIYAVQLYFRITLDKCLSRLVFPYAGATYILGDWMMLIRTALKKVQYVGDMACRMARNQLPVRPNRLQPG
jgi:hypothetical protein